MELSIIIVNYNTYHLTKQTIDSIIEKEHIFNYEIILVDNASSDGSIEALKKDFSSLISKKVLKVFINNSNLGFAKANNIGIKNSVGKFALLLNSDTVIKDDCLEKCLSEIDKDPNIGALGCKVVLPDGKLDHACKRGFPTPKASLYYLLKLYKKNPIRYGQYDALHLDENQTGQVDCLMGAFMLIPKAVLNEVGLLDENFFMYGEDIDLCYRIKENNYKILYYPEAAITHHKGGSSKKRRTKVIYDFHNAMWIFYKKHYSKKYNFAITVLIYIGIWTKYLLEILKNMIK